jgi:hypothetical protein
VNLLIMEGVRPEIQCSLERPIEQLKQIQSCSSPLEKLSLIEDTINLIMKSIPQKQDKYSQGTREEFYNVYVNSIVHLQKYSSKNISMCFLVWI